MKVRLPPLEARFLQTVGEQIGSIRHVDAEDRGTIVIDMMTGEAIKTSEIEGWRHALHNFSSQPH